MKKRKIRLFSLLFSAIIAAVVFFYAAKWVFQAGWGFNLSSPRHWEHILKQWQKGWVIHKPREVFFFIALLLLIPGYIGTWLAFYVLPLKKILLLPKTYFEKKKKAALQAKSLAAALGPENRQEILAAKKGSGKVIKISSEKLHHIDHLRGKGNQAAQPSPSASPAASASPETVQQTAAAARFDLWNGLAKDLEGEHIAILRQMKIQSFPVNIFAITKESLFLLCEGPATGESWEVAESTSHGIWKTESGEIPSPLRPMVKAKNVLRQYFAKEMPEYADLNVNCCMILDHGNITNTDDLLKSLEEWDISVLRMGSCKTKSLPDTRALIEYIKSQPTSSKKQNDAVAVAILDLMETDNDE